MNEYIQCCGLRKWAKIPLILILAVTSAGCEWEAHRSTGRSGNLLDLIPAFGGRALPNDGVARIGDHYLLADATGDRILQVDRAGEVVESWSTLTTSSMPIQEPLFLARVDEDSVLTYLGRARSALWIDMDSRLRESFVLEDFFGVDLSASNRLWVGRPWSGWLVDVHDLSGKKVRSFGTLKTFEESYPEATQAESIHPRLRDPYQFLNLVHLESDHAGGGFATFRFSPVVQRYNQSGELLWETRLEGKAIQQLEANYLHDVRASGNAAARMKVYGATANLVTMGSAFDASSGRLLVLLPSQKIVVLDRNGRQGPTFSPRFSEGDSEAFPFLLGLHTIGSGKTLFTNPVVQRSWMAMIPENFELASGE